MTAHATRRENWRNSRKRARRARREPRRTTQRPLALGRKPTAAAAKARTPGTAPNQLSAAARRTCANGAILPAKPLLKPSKITVKAVSTGRTTGHRQDHQVHVHAKTTLTVIFRRFH
jgi:hypothetical protein